MGHTLFAKPSCACFIHVGNTELSLVDTFSNIVEMAGVTQKSLLYCMCGLKGKNLK